MTSRPFCVVSQADEQSGEPTHFRLISAKDGVEKYLVPRIVRRAERLNERRAASIVFSSALLFTVYGQCRSRFVAYLPTLLYATVSFKESRMWGTPQQA